MYSVSEEYKNLRLADSTKHALKIYIDETEIDSKYILGFSVTHKLWEDNKFCFGSTESRTAELKIHKDALPDTYERVYIETGIDNSSLTELIPIGYFNVDKIEKENSYTVKLTLIDDMSKFEFNYDGSVLTYPKTMLEVLQDICDTAGIELGSTEFLNSDKEVAVYDNTVTARTYIGYIAEQAGGFAIIGRDGKLYIRTIGEDTDELELKKFADYTWGEEFKISRIAYEDGVQDFKAGDETNNTVWIDSNNMYIVDQEQIDNIYNNYSNFDCYSFSGTSIVDPAWDIGDIITIDGKKIIYQGTMEYKGKFKASIESDIQCKAKEETTATTVSDSTKLRRVQSSIDQIEGKITSVVEEVDEQNTKISEVTQTVSELSQSISDIADITTSETGYGSISMSGINESEPIEVIIRPTSGCDVSYLYPNTGLYPSESVYPLSRILRFESTDGYIVDWVLPDDLLYYDEDNYDELTLNYDTQTLSITKKVGYNSDGSKYLLDTPVTTTYDYPSIPLESGDYTITLLGYSTAYLFVRLMAQNIYTTQFATKLELNSAITQTSSSILASVSADLDTLENSINATFELYVDTKNLISYINASADVIKLTSNRISITSDYFTLTEDGKITATDGNFTGDITLEADNVFSIKDSDNVLYMTLDYGGIGFYTSGEMIAGLCRTTITDTTNHGIMLKAYNNTSHIGIAYNDSTKLIYNSSSDVINIYCDLQINGGADGTLFGNNSAGGITVKSGIITGWSLYTQTGTVTIDGVTLTFADGLLVGVS